MFYTTVRKDAVIKFLKDLNYATLETFSMKSWSESTSSTWILCRQAGMDPIPLRVSDKRKAKDLCS